jgi:hypothetical protein
MLTQRKKRIVLLVAVAALCLIAVLITVMGSGPRIRILDPHFQILAFKFIHAKRDKMYWGNQLEGKVRDQLVNLGVPVKILPQDRITARTNSYTLSVMYRGDFKNQDVARVQAELALRTGTIIPLRWVSGDDDPKTKTYLSNWVLDPAPTNINRCTVRLSRTDDNHRLAEVDISNF